MSISEPRSPARQGIADARARAARALSRVWEDAAYASAALDTELSMEPAMDPRDAALATELVYGVLRTQGFLEARVVAMSSRNRGLEDSLATAHLLMGLYTVLFLEKIPAFAAVSEAVTGVRERLGPKPGGFANHVLRETLRQIEGGKPALADALVEGAPGWLRGALRRSIGRQGAHGFLAAGAVPAPFSIAVRSAEARSEWITRLAEAGAELREGRWSQHALVGERAGDPRKLPGFETEWIVQEEGAQVVALALGVEKTDRVLDACAGRGNKTWLLSSLGGSVVAVDKHPAKLEKLAQRMKAETVALDLSVGTGDLAPDFDRVLVDAPCSGVGTLRRRPEIALQKDPASITALAAEQLAITRTSASLAKGGGRLVYAVCSVLREECEDVVQQLIATEGNIRLEPAPFDAPNLPCDPAATSFRILPHVHGTDGFFVASFIVRRSS